MSPCFGLYFKTPGDSVASIHCFRVLSEKYRLAKRGPRVKHTSFNFKSLTFKSVGSELSDSAFRVPVTH